MVDGVLSQHGVGRLRDMNLAARPSLYPPLRLASVRLTLMLAVGVFACAGASTNALAARHSRSARIINPSQMRHAQAPPPRSLQPNASLRLKTNNTNPANTTMLAESLFKEGQTLAGEWNEASLRRAIEKIAAARTHWRSTGDVANEIRALGAMGQILICLSEYQEAVDVYRDQLYISKAPADRAEALNGLGKIYVYLGDEQKALAHSNRAHRISQEAGDVRGQAESLINMAEVYYFQGENKKALHTIERALALSPDPSWPVRARALIDKGYAYFDLRDMNQAFAHYEQSLSQSRNDGNRRGEALALTAIGGVYSYLGNKQNALEYQNQAVTIFRTVGDRNGEGVALNGLGYVYRNLAEHQKSLDCYLRALELFRLIENREFETFTLTRVGKAYEGLGDNLKALEYYRLALNLSAGYPQTKGQSLNSIGAVLESMHKNPEALSYYEQALLVFRSIDDKMGEASVLNSAGRLYSASGQNSKALKSYLQALSNARVVKDRRGEIAALFNLAQTERDAEKYEQARRTIEDSLSIIESLRTEVASTNLRASYFASVRQHHELYIDILMQLHRSAPTRGFDAEAFTASERGRARSLLELLGEAQAGIRQGVDPALLEQERKLQQELNARAERQMKLVDSKEAEASADLTREIQQLTNEYDQLEARIKSLSPRFAAFREPQPLSLQEVQQKAFTKDVDSMLLEYSLGEDRSYLWAVTRNEVSSFELPGRATIEAAARDVYVALTASQPVAGEPIEERKQRIDRANNELPSKITALSNLILFPVASRLGHRRLLVVPDGALQYIPFQVLTLPADGNAAQISTTSDGRIPLLIDHEIVNEPSASTLALLIGDSETHAEASNSVAVLADPVFEINDSRVNSSSVNGPSAMAQSSNDVRAVLRDVGLPGSSGEIPRLLASRDEAEAIMGLAPWLSAFKATDFEASRETAMNPSLSDYRVVHFATHGIINNEHPELSGVVLSLVDQQGRPQDGFLRLHDIYNLKLPVDLVVLSACNTGLGKDVKGEGLVGLTRGFMYAGASSVMASLWKVDDDATAELMRHFYKYMLQEGLAPAASLRRAQLEMAKQKRWQSPYYWSGFVIQGHSVLSEPRRTLASGVVLWATLSAILATAAFLIWKRRRHSLV